MGAAAVVAFALGFPVRRALVHWDSIDRPNERSSHSRPTVRGGGIAMLTAVMIVGSIALNANRDVWLIALAVFVLALVSFVDDLKSLPQLLRFIVQGGAALVALYGLFGRRIGVPSSVIMVGEAILGFVWIIGYTNAFNFMDGINGIAASQAAVTGLAMGLLSGVATGQWCALPVVICFLLAGASLGFLPHNFPKARMFMGDVGSAPLGFLLSLLVLWLARDQGWRLLVPLSLLHANFFMDAGITICRRIIRGERWHEAHREHFYQRLVRARISHAFVTLSEMGLQCVVFGFLTLYLYVEVPVRLILVGTVIMIWLSFFAWAEKRFKRFSA
jgi:UDP-N-acetylmuramyl pentapeptide phosphotransferase/UDP-N-acetylglucosamine-1-phosphate transferase